jgi:hypothetical protein
MTYFLGSTGFIFDDKFIRGQSASNSVDNSIINIYSYSNYVGIGNSNPQYPLHVNGIVRCDNLISNSRITTPRIFLENLDFDNFNNIYVDNLSNLLITTPSRVGINNTNPSATLDVNGNIKTNSALIIGSSTYTDTILNNTNTKAIYSSNILNNKLNLSGGTMTGALIVNGFTATSQIAKFQNGNSTNALFIEASLGAYYGKTAITFNGYSSGNNSHNFVNPTKSKWSIQVNQSGSSDNMGFFYVTPDSRATTGTVFLSFSNVGSYASNGAPLIYTGINNANPQYPLDVDGIIKTNSALVINSSTYTDVNLNTTKNEASYASNNIANINNNFLPITGGTLTGNLNFKNTNLYLGSSSGDDMVFNIPLQNNFIFYKTGGIALFQINEDITRNYTKTTFNDNVGIKTEATNNFALNVNGSFQANSAIINGNINASTLNVGSITATGTLNVSTNITCGNANVNGNIASQSTNVNGNLTSQSINVNGNITSQSANINGKFYNNKQLANYIAIDVNANSGSLSSYSPIYPLDVIGNTRNSSGSWLSGSDKRVKTNIIDANLETCYNNIKNLKLRNFQWNDMYAESNNITDNNQIGWIAQEVAPIFPKSVIESNSWGYSNFKDLSTDQIYKTMYGALQMTMLKLETLTQEFNEYKINHV